MILIKEIRDKLYFMIYYHGSKREIEDNTYIHSLKSTGYTSYKEVVELEELFEKYKPVDKISRTSAVYLVDNLDDIDNVGAYDDYIYEMEPVCNLVEKSDLHWYTAVSMEVGDYAIEKDNPSPKVLLMIKNYWNGTPSDNPVFEYRCYEALVVKNINQKDEKIKKNKRII
jgi:hypothetical protein